MPPPVNVDASAAVPSELVGRSGSGPMGIRRPTGRDSLNPRMQALLDRVLKRKAKADAVAADLGRRVRRRICGKTCPDASLVVAYPLAVVVPRRRIVVKTSPSREAAVDNALLRP